MSLLTHTPARVRRARVLGYALALVQLSCVGGDSVGTGTPVLVDLVPRFAALPSPFDAGPIDHITVTARDAVAVTVIATSDTDVDPSATEWVVSLGLDLAGVTSMEVVVDVELLSGSAVEWSGRTAAFTVTVGLSTTAQEVPVFRGPLDNLDVESVTILGAPPLLLVGGTAAVTADVQLASGSTASPSLFWGAIDPSVATVTDEGGVVTISAVAPGLTDIVLSAGSAIHQASIEVLPRVSLVDVTPLTSAVDGLGVQIPFSATVLDGFGNPTLGEPVTWASSDPSVATVDVSGVATTVGFGTTDVRATAAGVTGSGALTVNGPDLVVSSLTVTPDGVGVIVDLSAVDFQANVANNGPALGLASTLGIRVLDASTGLEVHPTLEYAVPPLNPGASFSFQAVGGGQVQAVSLPVQLRFDFVADFLGDVPEEDESNNVLASGNFDVQTGPPPAFTTWVGGDVSAPTDWFVHANWSPTAAPGIADDVVIPVTANDPVLTGSFQIADLTVEAGVTVDLGGLGHNMRGELISDGALANGGISLSGTIGTQMRGTVFDMTTLADRSLSGGLIVNGDLRIAEQTLSVGANTLTVAGQLRLISFPGDAILNMSDPAGRVEVTGAADFAAGDLTGSLVAGVLALDGDLTASSSTFAATGTHLTQFTGSTPQQISLSASSPTSNRFQDFEIGTTAAVSLAADVYASGNGSVSGQLTVAPGQTLDLGGALTLRAGSTLNIDGTVTAIGGCTDFGATIVGSGTHPCVAPQFSKIWVGGDVGGPTDWGNSNNWNPAGAPTVSDDVLIDVQQNGPRLPDDAIVASVAVRGSAALDLGGFTLTVVGDLEATQTITNGLVVLSGAGSVLEGIIESLQVNAARSLSGPMSVTGNVTVTNVDLDLNGQVIALGGDFLVTGASAQLIMTTQGSALAGRNVTFDGGSHVNFLTEGVINVGGDFTVTARSSSGFAGTGNHLVVFNGAGLQSLSLAVPGTAQQRFANLAFLNSGVVTLQSELIVSDVLTVRAGSVVDASDDVVRVAGGFVDPNGDMTMLQLRLFGDVAALPLTLTTDLFVDATVTLPNSLALTGNLTLNNQDLIVGTNTLGVSGNLTVTGTGAQLAMQDASSIVDVEGDVLFNGGGHTNFLTAGTLSVAGNFTAGASSNGAFVGLANHTVVFDGTGPQIVTFTTPATNLQRFQNVTFSNTLATTTLLSDVVAMGTLQVASGATVDASNDAVSVAGAYVDVANGMTALTFRVVGDLTAIPTTLATNMIVSATFNLPTALALTGNLTLNNNDLIVGANTLGVSGNLTITGTGAQLAMQDASSIVDVEGDVLFNGGSHTNFLTAGTLRVAGNFTAGASSNGSFVGLSNHTVVFDGTGLQSVSFTSPATNLQRFQNVTFSNTLAATTFLTDVVAMGTLQVTSGSTVNASDDAVSVAGAYIDVANGMTALTFNVAGDLSAIPTTLATNMSVNASFTLPNALALTGNLTLNNNDLVVGANTLGVSGNLTVTGTGAQLAMQDASSIVDVEGDALFNGGSHTNFLTAGTLRVAGNFTAGASSNGSFVGLSNHTVVFDGTGLQSVSFTSPATNLQRFQNVTFSNTLGATAFGSDVVAMGTLQVTSGSTVNASASAVSVAGAYIDIANGMTVLTFNVAGDLTAIPPTLAANMNVNTTFNLPSDLALTGDLTLNNQDLFVGTNTLGVSGNLTVTGTGAQLSMQNTLGIVDVEGDVLFNGGSHTNFLTAGVLRVAGNFTAGASSNTSFVGRIDHTVVFDGTGPQSVTFTSPATNLQRFRNVTFSGLGAVTLLSDVVAMGTLQVSSASTVNASDDAVSVGGAYDDVANGLTVLTFNVVGDLTAIPPTLAANMNVNTTFNLPSDLALTGDLTLNNNDVILAGNRLFVTGDVAVTGTGAQLQMTNAADTLDVFGDVTFAGGSHVNFLTAGFIRLTGNFTASGSTSAFVGQANHTVDFIGTGLQTVSFSNPGVSTQRFANLTLSNFGVGVSLATSSLVTGTFIADDIQINLIRSGPLGTLLDIRGTVNVPELTVVGLPIRVESTVAPPLHTLNNVVFQGMDPADVQLYLELPGLGANAPLNMSGMTFDSPGFTTGAHLQTVRGSGAGVFVTELFFPNPIGSGATILVGANTSVIWP